ncbi:MAG: radical SAM protein [Deltaproteobacteria bacterium]|nr:radical SAM protein [Deltaproteobacteria bacterium]
MQKKLTINEIFYSIQGESYLAGLPCVFIRLTGCHQRCTYCDSEFAFYEGQKKSIAQILESIKEYPCRNVLVTGGEPLLQDNATLLMSALLQEGYHVAVETGGNRSLEKVPKEVVKVMDLKTPSSGECERNNYNNLNFILPQDEIKFVVQNSDDIDWAIETVQKYQLEQKAHVSISPTKHELLPTMAEKILESGLKIRQQVQLHKLIWPGVEHGV